ncbi:MAG: hypothetical protein AB7V16_12925 [Vulcanibacillus sp.]
MKQLIIIVGTILLGIYIFGWILGDGDSLKNQFKSIYQYQVDTYK